ncbi:GspE/PulE family protein [Sporomusa sp. KB1]|jgi:type IV pilus assembly protein PilB|uniref:GspE/PulE family protein n=1 Tax=Sporomusa sp. KB1 TaxID=943346 RepID=UPI0011A4C0DA|nr:GspE/PulE family protein [Sporomusa sp. KB1]TWH48295.1 type IV pilus assembly protein PilB [Sporomusa sp. KB1]
MVNSRKHLGDLLIEANYLRPEQLEQAVRVQKKTGERLEKVLINLGYITEANMIEVLEFQLGVPYVNMVAMDVAHEIAATIPVSLAERYKVIPIKKEGRKLTLAMADPTNFFAIDDVRMASGCEVEPVIAAEREIMRAINQSYGVQDLVEKAVNKLKADESDRIAEVQLTDDAPIVSIVNSIISQAIKERASDIHIEPQEKLLRVRFRVDGVLREVVTFPRHTHAAIISRIKIMSELDIAEKRLPQDGRIKVQEFGRDIDLRVSTLPTITGEKIVLRILDKNSIICDIKGLGFAPQNLTRYRKLYSQSYGMILVTGPTGSGKTTTLYSTLTEISTPSKNVITVEEPVEYRLDGVNQVQINHKAGLNFANGLRSILRQDPNVVMVGEIRDAETADIAIRAALTGHLVFSTLHTNDAPGAITRLIDMGIEPFLVASSVLGIVAQRLVRVICPECKQQYVPEVGSPEWQFLGSDSGREIVLYRGAGCSCCSHTGYFGRMAIHEVMSVGSAVREAINRQVSNDMLATLAAKEGMISMREDGISKAYNGLTTVSEVMRVAYAGT